MTLWLSNMDRRPLDQKKRREILYSGKERLSLAKFIRLSADTCVQTQEGRTFFLKYVTWDGDDVDDSDELDDIYIMM